MSLSARTPTGSASPRTQAGPAAGTGAAGTAAAGTGAAGTGAAGTVAAGTAAAGMVAAGTQTVWTATGHERPVFLDEHGRRRRWVLLGGALSGGASACWLAALVAGAIGFSTMPSLHERSQLLASRTATEHAQHYHGRSAQAHAHRRRRSPAARNRGGASPLNNTTELAVSRALIAAR